MLEQSDCRISECPFLLPLPTSHFDGLMITSIVTENTTEIVHPAMIPIVRHCHALVSTNPILWSILKFAHFVLKMGFNMILVAFSTQKKKKSTRRGLYGAEPNASSRSITLHVSWLDDQNTLRSHVALYFVQMCQEVGS